jgi:hypothetical protein
MGSSASYAVRFSDVIKSYDSAAKNPTQRVTLNQDPMAAAKACHDKKLAQTSAHLSVFASNRSPLAVIRNIVVLLAFQPVFVHHPLLADI